MTVGKTPKLFIPVAIHGITVGIGSLIILPMINQFLKLDYNTYATVDDIVWLLAAVVAFIGTVVALKPKPGGGIGDKVVWIFFMLVWIGMGIVPFLREGGF